MIDSSKIRNFSIIAHIDHGKSTLADRLIEFTNAIEQREFRAQILDSMDIERERGITIKSQTICLEYKAKDGETYSLNLIDTPGHVDFSYEVSRALAACESVLLVIDASQGVEAQTLANMYMALEHNLEIIPVINKIDLPSANIEMVKEEIDNELGLDSSIAIPISAKAGINIESVLEAVVNHCPPPEGNIDNPAKALIFDANYDAYRGVIVSVRIFEGVFRTGDTIKLFNSENNFVIEELGVHKIKYVKKDELKAGEVGYIIANIKSLIDTKIGDTITNLNNPCDASLPGYEEAKSTVFSSIFPVDGNDYKLLKDAMDKLKLNDASLLYEPETSIALGFGFRCGFLGLLHLEIVQERLEREYNLNLITTAPSVQYRIIFNNNEEIIVDNPANFPDPNKIKKTLEPFCEVNVYLPDEFLGNIMKLCQDKRGIQKHLQYIDKKRVQIDYELPLAEIVYDFHDRLKSVSKGYASYDYKLLDYRETEVVKVDILVNEKKVDALSMIMHKDKAVLRGRQIIEKLKTLIPRQMFKIPLQAAIGGNVIARENISAFRKDVTAKCYGGDISRKRKLLEKQKEGKRRMRMVGDVEIPQEAFMAVLKED